MRKFVRVANPCLQCGKRYRDNTGEHERRKYCSLACAARARLKGPSIRPCRKCKTELPHTKFPLVNGRRRTTCQKCYRPHGQAPLVYAPNPCRRCGRKFAERKPPSRMRLRLFCSTDCAHVGKGVAERRCHGCQKMQPGESFYSDRGRRTDYCQQCRLARRYTKARGVGYMAPFNQAFRHAQDLARCMHVNFSMTRDEAQRLYGSPCNFCGAPGCVFRPSIAGVGYERSLVGISCWLCSRLTQLKKGGLSEEAMLEYGKALVRWLKA